MILTIDPNFLGHPSRGEITRVTLLETNSSPLKIDRLKRRFLLETTMFRFELLVSGMVHPGILTAGTQKWRWMEDDFPFQSGVPIYFR